MHRLLACYICYTLRHSHVNSLWSWDHQAKCRSQAEPKHVGNGKQNKMISSNKNQYSADQRVIWLHLRMADLWVVQSMKTVTVKCLDLAMFRRRYHLAILIGVLLLIVV